VIVAFRTEEAVQATVDYGKTLEYGSTANGQQSTRHAIELGNLQPGERYYYRVRVGDRTLADGDGYFFETDAGRGDSEFSFFVTGDIGEPGGYQGTTADRVLATTPRAEIGLICGDVVLPDGDSRDYDDNIMRPWAAMMRSVAIWPALGNHDWHVDPDAHFREEWYLPNNEHYYSFDRGNAHFIALDTCDGDIYDRSNQIAWLRADLEAHRDAQWTFVFYHHPGYTCTYKGYNHAVIDNFHPLFDEFAVDVVFMGHAHTYERLYPMRGAMPFNQDQDPDYTDPSGTLYVTSGCGGKYKRTTTQDCELNAFFLDRTIMFTHVTVSGNVLTMRTIESASGDVRDRVTVTKTSR
jgi:hypothetical protein